MPAVHGGSEGSIRVSEESWPVVLIEYQGLVTAAMIEATFRTYAQLAQRAQASGERIAWLSDLSEFNPLRTNAAARKRAGKVLAELQPTIADATVAEARVSTSTIVRGVMTAVGWLAHEPWPVKIVGSRSEGMTWLRERLAAVDSRR